MDFSRVSGTVEFARIDKRSFRMFFQLDPGLQHIASKGKSAVKQRDSNVLDLREAAHVLAGGNHHQQGP